jgi:hypothetical protein
MSHAKETGSKNFPIINRVVDSLDVRLYRDNVMSSWLETALVDIRDIIKNAVLGQPDFFELPQIGTFEVRRARRGAYEFTLINRQLGDVHIWNPDKWRTKQVSDTGQLYVSFRSSFLQSWGVPGAVKVLDTLEGLFFGINRLMNPDATDYRRISRVDIAVDYADLRVHKMNQAQRERHSVVAWSDLDCYQSRAKRTTREAWLTPFNSSAEEVLRDVLKRSKHDLGRVNKFLKTINLAPFPDSDNRGGHCYTPKQNGFSETLSGPLIQALGASLPGVESVIQTPRTPEILNAPNVGSADEHDFNADDSTAAATSSGTGDDGVNALALERTVMMLADMLVEGVQNDGKAHTTRVIGSRKPQTVYLGRFGSDLYAREYNKQASLVVQNKAYLLDTWLQNGWDGDAPVWRLEFSLSGEALRQFVNTRTGERVDIRGPLEFVRWIPRVWNYLTRTWVRHTIPSSDTNQARWKPSERWQSLQNAWSDTIEIVRSKRAANPSVEHLEQGVKGYSKSLIAKLCSVPELRARALEACGLQAVPARDEKENLKRFWDALIDECKGELLNRISAAMFDEEHEQQFNMEVVQRQASFGLDAVSDTALSALMRTDRMKEGRGS